MPRKPRLFSPESAYHIIVRGNNRQTLFRKTEDFERYLEILGNLKADFPCEIYHYCLMTNHVHLLMRFGSKDIFQKMTHRMTLLYAQYYAREYEHIGHVFQDRFKGIPVENDGYLLECGRYIERNPVKARIADRPEDYSWSSYRYYGQGRADPLLTENPLFSSLGGEEGERRLAYEKYVMTKRSYETEIEKVLFGKYLTDLST